MTLVKFGLQLFIFYYKTWSQSVVYKLLHIFQTLNETDERDNELVHFGPFIKS